MSLSSKPSKRKKFLSWLAGTAAFALIASTFVVTAGIEKAAAEAPRPSVEVSTAETYIAGEDLDIQLTFGNDTSTDGFNLSAGLVIPSDVNIESASSLGSWREYQANEVLPGNYAPIADAQYCADLGLIQAPAPDATRCAVPEGLTYVVFENISDLPAGAVATHTLTLRPNASVFTPGDTIGVRVSALTSDDPSFLPLFPAGTGLGGEENTSAPGSDTEPITVNALRIEKSEPSPEDELLRGVHDNSTTYTLRVYHTGEGDITDTRVTDYLPAGLEYLGLGDVDNTTNANGNRGDNEDSAEYEGAPRLNDSTPAPEGGPGRWGSNGAEESVTTISVDEEKATELGLPGAGVYTRVVWNLGTLLGSQDPQDIAEGSPQVWSGTPGEAGYFEIRYRAAVPLFENTVEFGYEADITGEQIANLDNNRGPSTRHGENRDDDNSNRNADAQSMTNHAIAQGNYGSVQVSDSISHTIDAVDVRVVKSVNGEQGAQAASFSQNGVAQYDVNIRTSEYVSATLDHVDRPQRLVDDAGDGICYAFGSGTKVVDDEGELIGTAGGEGVYPRFAKGNPNVQGGLEPIEDVEQWNQLLTDSGVDGTCAEWPSDNPEVQDLTGAALSALAFDPVSGHFFMTLDLDPENVLNEVNADHNITYSAIQNQNYRNEGNQGSTTSGDSVENHFEFQGITHSRTELDNVVSASGSEAFGDYDAWDDSSAWLQAEYTAFSKHVLTRQAAGAATDTNIASQDAEDWVKLAEESGTFAIGDTVWYRISVQPPAGADARNPRVSDFLPAGVTYEDYVVKPSATAGLGSCAPQDESGWIEEFVPAPVVSGRNITFNLGSTSCFGEDAGDRFLPIDTDLELYLKATVTDVSAFGQVDFPENLAKFQQNNVDGVIYWDRDEASIEADQSARLVKGIKSNNYTDPTNGNPMYPNDNGFESNIDGQTVVQNDEVTFRLDVRAPRTETGGYKIIDVLPPGITKADIAEGSYTAALIDGSAENSIVASQYTATPFDPSDEQEYNALGLKTGFTGRSVIVWHINTAVPGSSPESAPGEADGVTGGLTLGYTVTMPGENTDRPAELTRDYINDASIVEFDFKNNSSGSSRVIVNGTDTVVEPRTPNAGEYPFVDENNDTSDPSNVVLPTTSTTKVLVSTQVGPNTGSGRDGALGENDLSDSGNIGDQIVQGELATFRYSVTIPASTSVRGAELFDDGVFRYGSNSANSVQYEPVTGDLTDFQVLRPNGDPITDFDWAGFNRDINDGQLTFPDLYTNSSSESQTFAVDITVWVKDQDVNNESPVPNLNDGTRLTNTAQFSWSNPNSDGTKHTQSGTASAVYREPAPTIEKEASPEDAVSIDDTVTYSLRVNNPNNLPKSYDNVVVDSVPAGLLVDEASFRIGSTNVYETAEEIDANHVSFDTGVITGESGDITWSYEQVDALAELPTEVFLFYQAKIDPLTGGGQTYTNDVTVTGHTLPGTVGGADTENRRGERSNGSEATVTAATAALTKGVRIDGATDDFGANVSAPIGETVEYQVRVTLEPGINYYNARIVDAFSGTNIGTPERVSVEGPTSDPVDSVPGTWTYDAAAGEWTIDAPRIESATDSRTLTLTYQVKLDDDMTGDLLQNTARFQWTTTQNGDIDDPEDRGETEPKTATVDILNPVLGIHKDVKFEGEDHWGQIAAGDPDQTLNYRISVTNTGNTASFNNVIVDTLPAGVVNPTGFTVDGDPIASPNTAVVDGNTITWMLPGAIASSGGSVELGYNAEFADSSELASDESGVGHHQRNTASVTSFESFENGGRTYTPDDVEDSAVAQPQFPYIELEKTVADTSRTAYVGEPFEWILTATNTGAGAAQTVELTDLLPENWEFTEVQSVIVAGAAQSPITEPADTTGRELVWTFGADAQADGTPAAILQPGQSIEIRFTATPLNDEALTTPGVGSDTAHTNMLSAVTTDRTNETENATRSHTGQEADDAAFLREANLLLEKNAMGGITDPTAFGNLSEDTWIAGQTAGAGYAQPQWQVIVTNQGPDDSFGPFVISDTPPTPAGVAVGTWTARYHSDADDTVGEVVETFTAGTTEFSIDIGENRSLAADGSNWISLVTDVTISESAVSEGSISLENLASVLGKTYETTDNIDEDNSDDDSKVIEEIADLEVRKRITAPDSGVISVGEPITYTIDARNNGPSVSRGEITLTDTVPAGLSNISFTDSGDWKVTSINGSPASEGGPVAAGDLITWTYQGDVMPVNNLWTAGVTITGTIERSFTGDLVNWAQVHPDETLDPDYVENPGPGYDDQNNRDDARITPNDDTTVTIDKTRVVPDGSGSWRQADPSNEGDAFVAGEPVHYQIVVTNADDRADARVVKVVDESPEGLTYTEHNGLAASVWNRAAGGSNLDGESHALWNTFSMTTPATLSAGSSQSFVVSYDTATTITEDVVNWAEVTIGNWDRTVEPGDRRDRDDDTTGATRIVDLGIVKSHDTSASLTPGTEVGYTLVVTNHGASATNGAIDVVDSLPVGMSFVSGSATVAVSNGTAVPAESQTPVVIGADGAELGWSLLSSTEVLDRGDTITITYRALIDQSVRASIPLKNTVTVEGPDNTTEPSPDPNPNDDEETITTGPLLADMQIVKTVAPGPWIAGETATYTLTISNMGPSAVPANVHDVLPSGLTMLSMSGDGWDCSSVEEGDLTGDCVYTDNDELHPAGTATHPAVSTITVVAAIDPDVTTGTALDNDVVLTWVDETTKTDEDTAQITVTTHADLVLTKTAVDENGEPVTSATAGDTARYSLSVVNDGPSAVVAPLTVIDTLPEGVSFVRLISGGWTATPDTADNTVTFVRAPVTSGLASQATAPEIFYEVMLDSDLLVNEALENTATVTSGTPETDVTNNTDTAELTVERKSNVSVVKGHIAATPVDEYELGKSVNFTLDVSNDSAGPSNASGIVITDTLPAGLEFESISGTDWSIVDAPVVNVDGTTTVTATYTGELAPGATAERLTITATVTVEIGDNTEVTNTVCVDTDETNTNADPCDSDEIVVVPLADLQIEKSVVTPEGDITAGEPLSWQIDVRNFGPSASLSTEDNPITIEDTIPAGVHGIADPSTADWVASVTREGEPSGFPARAGDVVTWTFQGDRIVANLDETADPAFSMVLTATLDASWTSGEIINQVAIEPGETRDPEEPNNEDEVPVIPGDITDVRIGKTRVMQVDGEWVIAAEQDPVPNFVPGEDISYRITVINDGPADAREVTVVDETPEGLTYQSHESLDSGTWDRTAGGSNDAGDTEERWDTFVLEGTQHVGADNKREFVVTYLTDSAMQHSAEDPLINDAEVNAENDRDFTPENQRDRDNAHSTRSADLSIVKTHTVPVEGAAVVAGEQVEYRLLVTNHGPSVSDQPIDVVDTLPAGLSYVAATAQVSVNGANPVAFEPAIDGQNISWADITTGVDLAVDGIVDITFTALVDTDHDPADDIINAAEVFGPNDNNIDNNRSTDPITVTGVANLTIGKVAVTEADEITAGEPVTWLITPRNEGPSTSLSTADHPITVTDTLPEGIDSLVADPSTDKWAATTSNLGGWSEATAGDTITFTYLGERFVVGAEPDIEITAIIDPSWIGGDIENVATITPGETTDPIVPNEDTSIVTPGDRTALNIAKNRVVQVDGAWVLASSLGDDAPAFVPGTDVSYRIDVINEGPAIARTVQVVDAIPEGLSDARLSALEGFGEWIIAADTCEDGMADLAGYAATNCLTASLDGPLGIGVSEARSFIVTFTTDPALDSETPVVNWAEARADNVPEDERPNDEDSTANTPVADLSIVKSVEQTEVLAGDTVDYQLVVTNDGPSVARGPVTVADVLPLGMTYVAASARVAVAGEAAQAVEPVIDTVQGSERLIWTPVAEGEHLEPGETIVLTLQAVTAPDRIAPDGLRNIATVEAADDTNPLNNESEATIVVNPVVTLEVAKTAVGDFKVGEEGIYAITVTNHGPTVDPGPITVTDELPEGLTFNSSPDDGIAVNGQTVTWTLAEGLQVGESVELTLMVNVGKAAYPSVTNVVTIETPTETTPESILDDSEIVKVYEADPMPNTGGTVGLVVLLAGLLLLAGTGTLVLRERRRRETVA